MNTTSAVTLGWRIPSVVLRRVRICLVSFWRDGDGNRLEKSSGKIYWYGAGTEILDESTSTGSFTNEYVFFGGKRIAMRTISSGNIYYYEEDMLGSSRTMVQAGQTSVCFDADFLPFGYEKDFTTSCTQNYKFEGKERDTETNNDDFGARYYTFRLGRWLSADWSSVPAPVPYANLANPQTLNLYAMVNDNPESFADLDGHSNCPGGVDCVSGNSGGGLSNSGSNTNPNNNPNNNTTVHVCTTTSSAAACPTNTTAGANGQSTQQTGVQQGQNAANNHTEVYVSSGSVFVSRSTTATTTNADGSQTTTVTTTYMSISREQGHEGEVTGAGQLTETYTKESTLPYMMDSKVDTKQAAQIIGAQAVGQAQTLAATPSRLGYFGTAIRNDAKEHPGQYVAAGAGIASGGAGLAGHALVAAGAGVIGGIGWVYDAVTHWRQGPNR